MTIRIVDAVSRAPRPRFACVRPHLRFAVLCLAGFGAGVPVLAAAAASDIVLVEQRGRAFKPGNLDVARGQVVRFTNEDPFIHQVYVSDDKFRHDSGLQKPGATEDIAFTEAGTFQVLCAIHPRMTLSVHVQ